MKRYLVTGFLVLVPMYGISMATQELVRGLAPETKKEVIRQDYYAVNTVSTPQLTKMDE